MFADILLPRAIPKPLTYTIPEYLLSTIKVGFRVIVPLGTSKFISGIVVLLHNNEPLYPTKGILDVIDSSPIIYPNTQIPLFEWISKYYMCTVGEVLIAALPAALKLSSESRVQIHPEFDGSCGHLSVLEQQFLEKIQQKNDPTFNEMAKMMDKKSIHHLLKSLLDKQAIIVYEDLKNKYSPKRVTRISLHNDYASDIAIEDLMNCIATKHQQLDVILHYISIMHKNFVNMEYGFVDKSTFEKAGLSISSVNTLIKKNIFVQQEITISRFNTPTSTKPLPTLTKEQQYVFEHIQLKFETKDTVLLHGITGSGKTEIYTHLIAKALSEGKQVLYLLPEIAITTQLITRLSVFFGEKLGIYHSKYSDQERAEVWHSLVAGKYDLVIGVRSAIFLPFKNLSLIIVDEEHETSFKQQDVAPRYNARDTAIVLAKLHNAKVLLGSATPAVESYYSAQSGKYGFISLNIRYGEATLPIISLVNTRLARKAKSMREEFSNRMLDAMHIALDKGEQVLIFQNRRGYAPHIACGGCTWVPMCIDCSVSLTYHQLQNSLRCHYCGYRREVPKVCSTCGSQVLKNVGFGTEKLEESLKTFFPQKRVERMDLETTRSKNSYERIITAMKNYQIDILVGTQMVAKGLDFEGISLVGVMQVDKLLNMPDFRANERCFQLVTQVIGRAGRNKASSTAIVQTADDQNPILRNIVNGDYSAMYAREIEERKQHRYPPFVRLIKITVCHKDINYVKYASQLLAKNLKQNNLAQVSDPVSPLVARVRQLYHMDIWIKVPRTSTSKIANFKTMIYDTIATLSADKAFKAVRIVFDVDPL
jgi:primosomal protein N' (replication factor Y)